MKQSGFIALVAVIILGAALLSASLGSAFLGLGEVALNYQGEKGEEVFALADGCLEEVLLELRRDQNYGLPTAPLLLSLPSGSCIIEVFDLGAGGRSLSVIGQLDEYERALQAEATIINSIVTLKSFSY